MLRAVSRVCEIACTCVTCWWLGKKVERVLQVLPCYAIYNSSIVRSLQKVNRSVLMTTSDDEYGFDDLVLDDRTLAVLDATEQTLSSAIPSTSPREQQPSKRLKTAEGWIPRYVQQPHGNASASKGLIKSRFSLEDTDLPEITISNGFYSGPGRFFVGSQQSEPSTSPKTLQNSRESAVDSYSDAVLPPTAPQQIHAINRTGVMSFNHPSKHNPPARPTVASQPNRERAIPTNIVHGSRKPPVRHPSPALSSTHVPRTHPLARSSSFNDIMRAAVRSALSEVDSPTPHPLSFTAASGSPSPQPLHAARNELELLKSQVEEARALDTQFSSL
jgi:hypothetical protein